MDVNPKPNKDLESLEAKYNDRKLLWGNIERFTKNQDDWFEKPFLQLSTDEIEADMKFFATSNVQLKSRMHNLVREGKEGKDIILESFYTRIKEFESYMPVIVALGNRDIKKSHWIKIFE